MTIVFLQALPFFQLQLLVWQSLVALMILITFKPYRTKSQNGLKVFNEVMILLCIYHVFGMTDLISDITAKLYIGYSLVGFLGFFFVSGIAFASFTTVRSSYRKIYKWCKRDKTVEKKNVKPLTPAEN